jgi:hypothetical protein
MTDFVIKPLVLVKDERGADQYLYQGAVVPDYVPADRRKTLRDEGYISGGDDTPAVAAATEPASPPADESTSLPKAYATKAEWKAYALTQGMSEEEAEATSRDALAAKYAS